MLAPMIVNVLAVSLLLLALGWVSDFLRARSHNGRRFLNREDRLGSSLMSHSREPVLIDQRGATPAARRVRPAQRFGRLPAHNLAIGRVRPHGPNFVR